MAPAGVGEGRALVLRGWVSLLTTGWARSSGSPVWTHFELLPRLYGRVSCPLPSSSIYNRMGGLA
jgi:hypothetical protein